MSETELLKRIRLLEIEVRHWANRESALMQWLAAHLIADAPGRMSELLQILSLYTESHSDDLFSLSFLRNLSDDLAAIRPEIDTSLLREEIERIEKRSIHPFLGTLPPSQ